MFCDRVKVLLQSKEYIRECMIQWMKENIVSEYPGIEPMLMGESEIALPDLSVDFVIMIALHHELESPVALLKEAFRIVKN